MAKINKTIVINAPREKVWHVMLDDATYRQWTEAFNPGSYYTGELKAGEKVLFLGPSESGEGGMVSSVHEVRPNEFISFEHRGIVMNGVEDTESDEAKKWKGFETYTFSEVDGGTELVIEVDTAEEMAEELEKMWDDGLVRLKALAEAA